MSKLSKALIAAAGNSGGAGLTVEDVFSTYLYTGTGADQTITNGIDLDGEGGMVWIKNRSGASYHHALYDTNRGAGKVIYSSLTSQEYTASSGRDLTSFNSDGFSLGIDQQANVNPSGLPQASWTFRKAEKFFDVVTYTGNGVAGRTVAHNLGSTPACMIVKRTNASQGWAVYHVGMDATNPENWMMRLNATDARFDLTPSRWNDTAPTSTDFTLSDNDEVNGNGDTYVAYLFASDAGGFGDDGSESIIKCGSYTGNGSNDGPEIDLGFEPQWVLFKNASTSGYDWRLYDSMRGIVNGGGDSRLMPNLSNAEDATYDKFNLTPTGFKIVRNNVDMNGNGDTIIYIAIRRPMKTPESGTEVFAIDTAVDYSTNPSGKSFDSGFPVDMFLNKEVDQSYNNALYSRLTNKGLRTNTTDSEFNMGGTNWDSNIAVYQTGSTNTNNYGWMFKRATGFFDVVAYTGTGVARTVNHNLGVVPELMILKVRNRSGSSWVGYHKDLGNEGGFSLTSSAAFSGVTSAWNSTTPTSSVFTVGTGSNYNGNTDNLIAYLFATLAGVSKVGSYTGTGSNVDVDCGFSAGARFILIKRTDSTGDWYVYDSVRGIVAGNDPYLLLNSTAAEVTNTDYIDPLSSGFTVTSSAPAALNASGGTYIFLAIA
jgi:hypothetical protein